MFIATQFTIAKCWKQPKCPSVNEWTKKLWYIYAMEIKNKLTVTRGVGEGENREKNTKGLVR